MSWPEPGDSPQHHTGVWIVGSAPGSIWGKEPMREDPASKCGSLLNMALPCCTGHQHFFVKAGLLGSRARPALCQGHHIPFNDALGLCWTLQIPFRMRGEKGKHGQVPQASQEAVRAAGGPEVDKLLFSLIVLCGDSGSQRSHLPERHTSSHRLASAQRKWHMASPATAAGH